MEGRAYSSSSHSIHSSLHSIRKPTSKPWKKPVAPLPPTPAKVYKVDPINFRDIVQRLTGAPEFAPEFKPELENCAEYDDFMDRRLQNVAPSPIKVSSRSMTNRDFPATLELLYSPGLTSEFIYTKPSMAASNTVGIELSPSSSSYAWWLLSSPEPLSTFEQSTAL